MAKKAENEWISIGDMLSSFVAVLIMIIIGMQQQSSMNNYSGAENLKNGLIDIAGNSDSSIVFEDGGSYYKLILKSTTFRIGSPLLTDSIRNLIIKQSDTFFNILDTSNIIIRVEGHADSIPIISNRRIIVNSPINEPGKSKNLELSYDYDNVMLSLQRAMEIKRLLAYDWSNKHNKDTCKKVIERVSVLGYGFNKPITRNPNESDRNRRVEIYFEYLPTKQF